MTKGNDTKITTLPGNLGSHDNVTEYTVAAARTQLTYPAIQQCISITGFNAYGLLGAHVSPGANNKQIAETFKILIEHGGKSYPTWYVVGNFEQHFKWTKVGWNSTLKIAGAMRDNLGELLTYYSLDTSAVSKGPVNDPWSWGIDIRATHTTSGVEFAYAKALGPNTKTFTTIPDVFFIQV
ncbi:hypothetical protein [Paraburkholderia xenovorans]|uniref:hypothetical protein n=1 Tax=Paraburkholderia xenovorans TaxID=36873 RepID=UPI0038B71153